MKFKILKKSKNSRARRGVIETDHGVIETPAFVPVGTQATVKGITVDQLKKDVGAQTVLCNTYHLYLRPGDETVKKMGGLHKFMNWDGPIWTDSGGFQVFSLGAGLVHNVGKLPSKSHAQAIEEKYKDQGESEHANKSFTKITENGVEFRSHLDGSKHFFTPEVSMKIQENLGADLIFAFDECTSPFHDYEYTKRSMQRTHRWAERSLKAFQGKKQALYGIVQGGKYRDLREASAKFIAGLDFDGIGIGGVFGDGRGDTKKDMRNVMDWILPHLPENKPRHLLGIGSPEDIPGLVKQGIDTFDCVIPTRLGRTGEALLAKGTLNLKAGKYLQDKNPIDKKCRCSTCQNYSRAYLTHLFKAHEMLGPILTSIHNLYFMEELMKGIRKSI